MIVYKITNKIDNKQWIGQTIRSLEERWAEHCKKQSPCRYLKNAIQKYGRENFEIKILVRCNSIEEMNRREQYYIRLLNTLAPNGYNLDSGGKNKLVHPDTRRKLSESLKGNKHPNFGKAMSEEQKFKISEAQKGKNHRMFGRHLSEETKVKISKSNKGRTVSQETKNKQSEVRTGRFKGKENHFFGKNHSEETKRKISETKKKRLLSVGL
jgi:group I intron endonuclease